MPTVRCSDVPFRRYVRVFSLYILFCRLYMTTLSGYSMGHDHPLVKFYGLFYGLLDDVRIFVLSIHVELFGIPPFCVCVCGLRLFGTLFACRGYEFSSPRDILFPQAEHWVPFPFPSYVSVSSATRCRPSSEYRIYWSSWLCFAWHFFHISADPWVHRVLLTRTFISSQGFLLLFLCSRCASCLFTVMLDRWALLQFQWGIFSN